jgi:hypothetical protein
MPVVTLSSLVDCETRPFLFLGLRTFLRADLVIAIILYVAS